jgi:hypothetical protein
MVVVGSKALEGADKMTSEILAPKMLKDVSLPMTEMDVIGESRIWLNLKKKPISVLFQTPSCGLSLHLSHTSSSRLAPVLLKAQR